MGGGAAAKGCIYNFLAANFSKIRFFQTENK
jgi:hypothetical protein